MRFQMERKMKIKFSLSVAFIALMFVFFAFASPPPLSAATSKVCKSAAEITLPLHKQVVQNEWLAAVPRTSSIVIEHRFVYRPPLVFEAKSDNYKTPFTRFYNGFSNPARAKI